MTQHKLKYEYVDCDSQDAARALQYGEYAPHHFRSAIDSNLEQSNEDFEREFNPDFLQNFEAAQDDDILTKSENEEPEEINSGNTYNALDVALEGCSQMAVDESTFGSKQMRGMALMQLANNFRAIFPDKTFRREMAQPITGDVQIYCNTISARRAHQKKAMFGLACDEEFVERNFRNECSIGFYLSMPGMHSTIRICKKHQQDYEVDDFFKVYFKSTELDGRMEHPQKENQEMTVMHNVPMDSMGEDSVWHFTFYCVTSCLQKLGDAKCGLRMNFVLMDRDLNVVNEYSQSIRITANPQRDAELFESREAKAKRTGKRTKSKPRTPLAITQDRDDDYIPDGKRVKQEPRLPMRRSSSRVEPNTLFSSVTNMVPEGPERNIIQQNLLRMNSQDRNQIMMTEQKRFTQNLLLATQPTD